MDHSGEGHPLISCFPCDIFYCTLRRHSSIFSLYLQISIS